MGEGMTMMNTKVCYKCGKQEPEYITKRYSRDCSECGGRNSVLTITEMCDQLFDLDIRGHIHKSRIEDMTDTDFNETELDFNDDTERAYRDAFDDYMEGED